MYRVTRVLSLGPFASPERADALLASGVTHVLNVSDEASVITSSEDGFREVAWVPMSDSHRLHLDTAMLALDTLHDMASVPGSHVYVHCRAGLVRSPTILWLYLISLGVSPREARKWIQGRIPMANAGSARMVDREHVLFAHKHGVTKYRRHSRGEIIMPFDVV